MLKGIPGDDGIAGAFDMDARRGAVAKQVADDHHPRIDTMNPGR